MLQKLKNFIIIVACTIIGLLVIYLGSDIILTLPNRALLFVDETTKTYYSPSLIESDDRDFLILSTLDYAKELQFHPGTKEVEILIRDNNYDDVFLDFKREIYFALPQDNYILLSPVSHGNIKGDKYKPDDKHRNRNGFIDELSPFERFLDFIGLRKSRWADDGSWNW